MQSAPAVPVMLSLLDVPMMTCVPAGQQDGSSPSVTVTVWIATAAFPAPSLAVHRTIVVPTEKCAGASLVMVTPQGSLACACPMLTDPHVDVVIDAGTKVNSGGVRSGPN